MTANPSILGAVAYNTESSWGENLSTFGTRLQVHGAVNIPANIQSRIAENPTRQAREDGKVGVRGPWEGSFSISFPLTGYGSTAAGSLSATDQQTFLKHVFGSGSEDQVGSTVATPTDAGQFSTAGGTFESFNGIRVGVLGDGRCEGQWAAVDNPATLTVLTDLPAAPNASDVVSASMAVYPRELPSSGANVQSLRFWLATANGQWIARGCFPTAASITGLNTGEIPMIEITFGVSWWENDVTLTFPSTDATGEKDSAIVGAGSFFLQTYGTATRQTFGVRDLSVSIDMQTVPLYGPGGVDQYQTIVGARRTRCAMALEAAIDAEANGTQTLQDLFEAEAFVHCLAGLSVVDGKALAIYLQRARITQSVTQEDIDGLNRCRVRLEAMSGATQTNDETTASWRMWFG